MKRNLRSVLLSLLVIVATLGLAGLYLSSYYVNFTSLLEDERGRLIDYVANRRTDFVKNTLDREFDELSEVLVMAEYFDSDKNTLLEYMRLQEKLLSRTVMFVFYDGNALKSDGQEQYIGDESAISIMLTNGNAAMSYFGKNLMLAAACSNEASITYGERRISGIATLYDEQAIKSFFSMDMFSDESSFVITMGNGEVVLCSSNAPIGVGGNVLGYLYTATFDDYSILELTNGMKEKTAGKCSFRMNGVAQRMHYSSIENTDCFILTFSPTQSILSAVSDMLEKAMRVVFMVVSMFSLLFLVSSVINYVLRSRLQRLIYIDSVTGINTEHGFMAELEQKLSRTTSKTAIIYTNIKKFKLINDQHGKEQGDLVLRFVAETLQSALSEREAIGRINADNFAILLTYEEHGDIVNRIEMFDTLLHRYVDDNGMLSLAKHINMCYGICEIKQDNKKDLHRLIDYAILASKSIDLGHGDYCFYDDSLRAKLVRDKRLEDLMHGALVKREFVVYLQPKYSSKTKHISGAEALVRWDRGENGIISPVDFIPLFENNGFVTAIDLYVFEEVCFTLRKWLDEGKRPIPISINVSGVHFSTPHFIDEYKSIFKKYNIPPELIELEITETVAVNNIDAMNEFLKEVHDIGFKCSMDDFGSGNSSLNVLKELRVDAIKLDRTFLSFSDENEYHARKIVSSIVALSHELGLNTVAEGVESMSQVNFLSDIGCDLIQGYIFARAMPVTDFERIAFWNVRHV